MQDEEPGTPSRGLQVALAIEFQGALGHGVADVAADGLQGLALLSHHQIAMEVGTLEGFGTGVAIDGGKAGQAAGGADEVAGVRACLLYTSDAADE